MLSLKPKKKKELSPGSTSKTPAASRKVYTIKGAGRKWFDEKVQFEFETKTRYRVVRQKMSGGEEEGMLVFGDVSLIFGTSTSEVNFSHLYESVLQYGLQGPEEVYWLISDGKDLMRYVLRVPGPLTDCPPDCSNIQFFLEEMDRSFLDFEHRRFKQASLSLLSSSDSRLALLSPRKQAPDARIAAMWNTESGGEGAGAPKHVEGDRFPVRWINWKQQLGLSVLREVEERALVLLLPVDAGVLILNPCFGGNARFLGSMLPIRYQLIKSWGDTKSSFSFTAKRSLDAEEEIFLFHTERGSQLSVKVSELALKASMAGDRTALFPQAYPPLRYTKTVPDPEPLPRQRASTHNLETRSDEEEYRI